jgi:hypothetical protein
MCQDYCTTIFAPSILNLLAAKDDGDPPSLFDKACRCSWHSVNVRSGICFFKSVAGRVGMRTQFILEEYFGQKI